jgi:hypothetical protein
MTRKDDLKGIHEPCLNIERDKDGAPTGAVCRKSRSHRNPDLDPRRRAHFDPDRGTIWGLDVEAMTS